MTCEWDDGCTQWTGRTELGSAAQYYNDLATDAHWTQWKAHTSSLDPAIELPHSSRTDKTHQQTAVEHSEDTFSKEVGSETAPTAYTVDLSTSLRVNQDHQKTLAALMMDDDSGRWTRGRRTNIYATHCICDEIIQI